MINPSLVALADFAAPSLDIPARPYPGMRPFGESEWQLFFGREIMVDEVIKRLVERRLIVLHGDSGSGKSSLVLAGVLPVLMQRSEHNDFRWRSCHVVPAGQPIENLIDAFVVFRGDESSEESSDGKRFEIQRALSYGRDGPLALAELIHCSSANPVCLLLDQFEELFTLESRRGQQEIREVIEFLIGAYENPANGFHVILTMRSEFLGACARYRDFAETVNATQYLLPRMKRQELLRAIREPARLCGGEIERELADCLIDETSDTPDQLPLIQHGLMTLHGEHVLQASKEAPDGYRWILTREQYRLRGLSLAELLSERAGMMADASEKEVFPDREKPRVVERIFRAITRINADGQPVRHPQTLAQLTAITGERQVDLQDVLRPFRAEGASFLRPFGEEPIAPDDLVDLSHEALIRSWQRASKPVDGWLAQEFRNGLAWRLMVEQVGEFKADKTNVISPTAAEDRKLLILSKTRAWSERYGGQWDEVNRLVSASIVAGKQARQLRTVLRGAFVALMVMLGALLNNKQIASKDDQIAVEKKSAIAAEQLQIISSVEGQRRLASIDVLAQVALSDNGSPAELRKQLAAITEQATGPPIGSSSSDSSLPPRVYFFISEESQRASAQAIADKLSGQVIAGRAVVVPAVTLAKAAPPRSVIRCFTEQDCAEASVLFNDVKGFIAAPVPELQRLLAPGSVARPRHFEIWFAPGPITPSTEVIRPPINELAAPSIAYSQEIVDSVSRSPVVPYPQGTRPGSASTARKVVAIVIHDARAPDSAVSLMRTGRPDLPGPLAQWAVQSDGTIVFIADEGVKANHAGKAIEGLFNSNTIGIQATGTPALANPAQVGNLIRLLVDVADRWEIPTGLILSHGEVGLPIGRNTELLQQAPVIRQMVEAVRVKRAQQGDQR